MFTEETDLIKSIYKDVCVYLDSSFDRFIDDDSFIQEKTDTEDVVTTIDYEINDIICSSIGKLFPDDAILSEENKDDQSRLKKDRLWIVDPIDWTWNLVKAIRGSKEKKHRYVWVHIAFLKKNIPQLWFVGLPLLNESFFAIKDKWSFHKTKWKITRLQVQKNEHLISEFADSIFHNSLTKLLISNINWRKATFGNVFGYNLLAIAENKITAYYAFPLNKKRIWEWDICAPWIILSEAGWTLTDMCWNPFNYNNRNPFISSGIIASWITKNVWCIGK